MPSSFDQSIKCPIYRNDQMPENSWLNDQMPVKSWPNDQMPVDALQNDPIMLDKMGHNSMTSDQMTNDPIIFSSQTIVKSSKHYSVLTLRTTHHVNLSN